MIKNSKESGKFIFFFILILFSLHSATIIDVKSPDPSIDKPIAFSNFDAKKAEEICDK